MKHIRTGIAFLIASAVISPAQAELVTAGFSVETRNAELLLTGPETGFVLLHECDKCPLKLPVNADTRAYAGTKAVSLEEARGRMRQGVTVIWDKKTGVVTELVLMSRPSARP